MSAEKLDSINTDNSPLELPGTTKQSREELECVPTCPNRRINSINLLFLGKNQIRLDPFEILLFMLIAVLPVGLSLRDAWDDKLTFRESIERIAMISALGALVRLSPTEQVSNFLSSFYLGKK